MKNAPKTVLITGAARRIGRAMALDLASHGWQIGIHFHGSGADARNLANEISAAGAKAVALKADLRKTGETRHLVKACADRLGPVTCLINNASRFENDTIQDLTSESWAAHMDINLRAPLLLAQAMAAALPKGQRGNIINMIDQRVWRLNPGFFSYTLSKSALWTATRTLAQSFAPHIRVNAIGPGPALASKRQSPENFEAQKNALLLKTGPHLDEICAAVRFILAAPSMTGQMIALDGGQHLAWQTPDIVNIKE